jgi:transcriptional regulator with XRE-family HTH domain
MAAPRKSKHSQAELAAMAGVSPKTIRDWRKEGVDLNDVAAVMRRAAKVSGRDETYQEARRRRAVAAADAEEIRVRRLKAELCEMRLARGVLEAVDHAVCTVWKQTPNELAGILDGLAGGPMRDAIAAFIDHTLVPRFAQRLAAAAAELERAEAQKITHT